MTLEILRSPWLLCRNKNIDARVRLICFPFAGGGASVYHSWPAALPDVVEVNAVQLPGRESRFAEPRMTDAGTIVNSIVDALLPLTDRPFLFFGYSIGALLAFECARTLRRRGAAQPAQLMVAAARAPHTERCIPLMSHLPKDEFLNQIRKYFEPSEEALSVPELLDILLPILRDDMAMGENYVYADEEPLTCPVQVYTGAEDKSVPMSAAKAWQDLTSAECALDVLPGGHFFINTHLKNIQAKVKDKLNVING